MTARYFAWLRRYRRPIIVIAVALVVLEVLTAGLAAARAAAVAAGDPFSAGVICHGVGSASPADRTTPDSDNSWNVCCTSCTSTLPALADLEAPIHAYFAPAQDRGGAARACDGIRIAGRAVRAGPSQGPPSSACV